MGTLVLLKDSCWRGGGGGVWWSWQPRIISMAGKDGDGVMWKKELHEAKEAKAGVAGR